MRLASARQTDTPSKKSPTLRPEGSIVRIVSHQTATSAVLLTWQSVATADYAADDAPAYRQEPRLSPGESAVLCECGESRWTHGRKGLTRYHDRT